MHRQRRAAGLPDGIDGRRRPKSIRVAENELRSPVAMPASLGQPDLSGRPQGRRGTFAAPTAHRWLAMFLVLPLLAPGPPDARAQSAASEPAPYDRSPDEVPVTAREAPLIPPPSAATPPIATGQPGGAPQLGSSGTPVPVAVPPSTVGMPPAAAVPGTTLQAVPPPPPVVADDPAAVRIKAYLDTPATLPSIAQPIDGAVRRFYQRRQFLPAWRGAAGWSPQATAALAALRGAEQDGLDPRAYHPDALAKAMATGDATAAASGLDGVTATDVALSVAMLRYVRDMSGGGLDGYRFGWRIPWEYTDPAQLLTNALAAPDIAAWFAQLAPSNQAYAGLKVLLAEYRRLAERPWRAMDRGPKLNPGDRDPRTRQLRDILVTLGDLPAHGDRSARRKPGLVRVAMAGDDLGLAAHDAGAGTLYDQALVQAVRRFQVRHGLGPDGVIGPGTQAALDISPRQRMEQIRANMQRLRWMPRDLSPRFISVNLPGYQLQAIENNTVRLSMRVVAGQPDWPTPIMADWVVSLKFAPTWTIPPKIARTETLARIKADPSYLDRLGLDVLYHGQRVSPHNIPWGRMTASNFSYTLRQRPGKNNALGLIRFSLTNPYDIYLHDTSNPAAFRKWGRNLSHGCVRVEKPAELGAFVMNDPAWPASRIQAMMNSPKTTVRAVPNPVPVYLVYFTAWRGAGGEAEFRADMYNLDAALIAAL